MEGRTDGPSGIFGAPDSSDDFASSFDEHLKQLWGVESRIVVVHPRDAVVGEQEDFGAGTSGGTTNHHGLIGAIGGSNSRGEGAGEHIGAILGNAIAHGSQVSESEKAGHDSGKCSNGDDDSRQQGNEGKTQSLDALLERRHGRHLSVDEGMNRWVGEEFGRQGARGWNFGRIRTYPFP